jgi:hypothetical protein
MEYKGETTNLQSSVQGSSWKNPRWSGIPTSISNPAEFHKYKVWLYRVRDATTKKDMVIVNFYVDDQWRGKHTVDYFGKIFDIIFNLQMEGNTGRPDPESAKLRVRNVYVGSRDCDASASN